MEKTRLDALLVQKGLAADRKAATALILSGRALVREQPATKPGALVPADAPIRIKGTLCPFVSRGGLKLDAALRDLSISVADKVCMDLGASTGGFTDCLLQRGARRVHAFDVGRGQLHWKLRQDPRVVVHDAVNVRSLTPDLMRELIQFVTIDLSFISLSKVLPALTAFAPTEVLALVKPQFEAAREEVEAGGLIRSPELRLEILERVKRIAVAHDFVALGETPSPIPGQKGNREFFLWWRVDSKPPQPD